LRVQTTGSLRALHEPCPECTSNISKKCVFKFKGWGCGWVGAAQYHRCRQGSKRPLLATRLGGRCTGFHHRSSANQTACRTVVWRAAEEALLPRVECGGVGYVRTVSGRARLGREQKSLILTEQIGLDPLQRGSGLVGNRLINVQRGPVQRSPRDATPPQPADHPPCQREKCVCVCACLCEREGEREKKLT